MQITSTDLPICIIFGRPGSGKSTLAKAISEKTESLSNTQTEYLDTKKSHRSIPIIDDSDNPFDKSNSESKVSNKSKLRVLHLDLDCCIPQWMKDNFAQGKYPTLEQRNNFALLAFDYVINEISETEFSFSPEIVMISFSFVNTDLRESFINSFEEKSSSSPTKATKENRKYPLHWILMDTDIEEANHRIVTREGHFYENTSDEQEDDVEKGDEWNFAPVTFAHLRLDGLVPLYDNANLVIDHMSKVLNK